MFLVTIAGFAVSLVASFVLTYFVRNLALKRGWVAAPHADRHIHCGPVPRVGGVAIYLAIVTTLVGVLIYIHQVPTTQFFHMRTVMYLLAPATVVFLLGLYDDLRGAGPYVKFGVQAVAAVMVYATGLRIISLPILFGSREFGTLVSLGLTVFWILWITNAFNLIDGVDGLAAGSALFSTMVVFIVSLLNGNQFALLLTAVLSGALMGFLRFNFNPATIFLGDSGSLFVGFMLGSLALWGQKSPTMVAVAIPVVSFGLPILETFVSIARRFLSGQPLFQADRSHIHHQLMKRGLSPRQTTLILYAVSALFALLSLFLLLPGGGPTALVLVVVGGVVWVGIQHLGYHELVELRRVAERTMGQKQIIFNNLVLRRAIASLSQCTTQDEVQLVLRQACTAGGFDRFHLEYCPAPGGGKDAALRYCWASSDGDPEAAPQHWMLEMPLGSGGEGVFRLYRQYSDSPLLLDITLLTRALPEALSAALNRTAEATGTSRAAAAAAAAEGSPLRSFESRV